MNVIEYLPNLWILDDGRVREFLILGSQRSLLIDTGFSDTDIVNQIKNITSLPIDVVLTHSDVDHIGNVDKFNTCMIHSNDADVLGNISCKTIKQDDCLDYGEYRLKVIELPGHTPGSIALYDERHHLLISGDSIQKEGPIYMFGPRRNLNDYIDSLKQLLASSLVIDAILPSHHQCPIDSSYIEKTYWDACDLRDGKLEPHQVEHMPCKLYKGQYTSFYY